MASHDEKFHLATELLDDIELGRVEGQPLLLKAARLARWVENESLEAYVQWELHGYPEAGHESAVEAIYRSDRAGRADDEETLLNSLPSLKVWAEELESTVKAAELTSVSGEYAFAITQDAKHQRHKAFPMLSRIGQIEVAVVATLHEMVSGVHNELAFSTEQATLFSTAQAAVDARLSTLGGAALDKIEAIYERLDEGGEEAVSHALSSCRRLINAVADALYPPSTDPIEVEGRSVKVTKQEPLNRIETFIAEHTPSPSRRKRLRRTLGDLYDRTSAGVHSDVSVEEARYLFLQSYVVLGEIVMLDAGDESEAAEIAPESLE